MANRDFCTVSDAKRFIDIRAKTTTDDALIQSLVTAASTAFRTLLSRDILSASYSERRDGTGTGTLVLKNFPVTAVQSVTVGPVLAPLPLTLSVDYIWTPTSIKSLWGAFPRGVGNIVVDYTAGYTTVPYDIAEKCAKTVALRYKQLERLGQTSKSIGGETVQFDVSSMPKDVVELLQNYQRRVPVATS